MSPAAELAAIAPDDFADGSTALVADWAARSVGLDGVEAALMFMEAHPDIDYGAPGALVHFAERFHKRGYEALLLASFARRPTAHTAWMMNRILNGTRDPAAHGRYLAALDEGKRHPAADARVRDEIDRFLELQAQH